MILFISLVLVIMSSLSFLVLLTFFFLVILAKALSILFLLECVGYVCYLDCGDGVMSVLQFVQTHQIVYIKHVQSLCTCLIYSGFITNTQSHSCEMHIKTLYTYFLSITESL